jgi:hypothetical protein
MNGDPASRCYLKSSVALCLTAAVMLTAGCISYRPRSLDSGYVETRSHTACKENICVTVAVLNEDHSKRTFGVNLYGHRIQPVWVKIENRSDHPYFFEKRGMDENYYSGAEAAYISHFSTIKRTLAFGTVSPFFWPAAIPTVLQFVTAHAANVKMDKLFQKEEFHSIVIPPHSIESGFVFTSLDEGRKHVVLKLQGINRTVDFSFIVDIGDIKKSYSLEELEHLCALTPVRQLDASSLGISIEDMPPYLTDKSGKKEGDPVNIAVVGNFNAVQRAFFLAGWHESESTHLRSAWRMAKSTFWHSVYEIAPMSPLYLFGRPQDISFQKTRQTVRQRHHVRLWCTSLRYKDKPVWVGGATWDIGVRPTLHSWFFFTHKIDPDVDAERDYILGELLDTERVSSFGFVPGVGVSMPLRPRKNLTGDPFHTDGYRAVIVIDNKRAPAKLFDWGMDYFMHAPDTAPAQPAETKQSTAPPRIGTPAESNDGE